MEAYVDFFYATPAQLEIAFPLGVSPSTPLGTDPPQPTEENQQRAFELEQSLPWLSCFSITEQELEALGDALGLPAPPPNPRPSPEAIAALMERMTGKPFDASELGPAPTRGPRLIPARHFPGGCGMIHQIPSSLVDRLATERDPDALGQKWGAAIVDGGPSLWVFPHETDEDGGNQDPRDDVQAWSSIARDLIDFVRRNDCANRKLYVHILFDC